MRGAPRSYSAALIGVTTLVTLAGASAPAPAETTNILGLMVMDDGAFMGSILEAWAFGSLIPSAPHPYGTVQTVDAFSNVGGPVLLDSTQAPRPGWDYELSVDLADSQIRIVPNLEQYNRIVLQMFIEESDGKTPISAYEVKYNGQVIEVEDIGTLTTVDLPQIAFRFEFEEYLGPLGVIDGVLTVQWNHVPAPGALALLGLAGAVRRRRRA
jgi:hypothetical protein